MSYSQSRLIDLALAGLKNLDKNTKIVATPPIMSFGSNRTTTVSNFTAVCRSFGRDSKDNIDYIKTFLDKEMSLVSSLNGKSQLVIKGRVDNDKFKRSLRKYFDHCVKCHICGSHSTTIIKNGKLYYTDCSQCGQKKCIVGYTQHTFLSSGV
jgi:translation initiation factor 2 beta subunit (eIF-2beta)/eIF-5